jgi:hypothetical protein
MIARGIGAMGKVLLTSLGVGLMAGVATMFLIVPGVIVWCGLFVAVPVAVMEPGQGGIDRSWELTKGHRWSILAVLAALMLVGLAAGAGAGLILFRALGPRFGPLFVDIIVVVAGSIGSIAPAVTYADLRAEKEGVNTDDLVAVFE